MAMGRPRRDLPRSRQMEIRMIFKAIKLLEPPPEPPHLATTTIPQYCNLQNSPSPLKSIANFQAVFRAIVNFCSIDRNHICFLSLEVVVSGFRENFTVFWYSFYRSLENVRRSPRIYQDRRKQIGYGKNV